MAEVAAGGILPPAFTSEDSVLQTPVQLRRPYLNMPALSPITEESVASPVSTLTGHASASSSQQEPFHHTALNDDDLLTAKTRRGPHGETAFEATELHHVLMREVSSLSERVARLEFELRSPARGFLEAQIVTIIDAARRDEEQRRELAQTVFKAMEEEREIRMAETGDLRASIAQLASSYSNLEALGSNLMPRREGTGQATEEAFAQLHSTFAKMAEDLAEQHTRAALDLVDRHMEAAQALDARAAEVAELSAAFRREVEDFRAALQRDVVEVVHSTLDDQRIPSRRRCLSTHMPHEVPVTPRALSPTYPIAGALQSAVKVSPRAWAFEPVGLQPAQLRQTPLQPAG